MASTKAEIEARVMPLVLEHGMKMIDELEHSLGLLGHGRLTAREKAICSAIVGGMIALVMTHSIIAEEGLRDPAPTKGGA